MSNKIKITRDEELILVKASSEMDKYGETDIRCPRCGSEIETIEYGNSYIIKCVKENCISASFRGL